MTETDIQTRISRDLVAAGLRPGGAVLVHTSLSSLGHVPGGPETLVRALLDALGVDGTLLFPGHSFTTVTERQPVFDAARTPVCVGAVPEYFRTRPGTIRSLHPTHSVCGIGAGAAELLSGHDSDETCCGPNSAYQRLRDIGGQIVFIGCGMRPNTSMHAVEELVEPPYLFCDQSVTYRMILADGSRKELVNRRHSFAGWNQRYDRLAGMLGSDGLSVGHVLEAEVHIVDCPLMWELAEATLNRDPFYFVERK